MYSPKIYESQIPSLYHAAQSMNVPMTQLANAFIYYGLASGDFGAVCSALLPQPNRVLPEGVIPQMEIFRSRYKSIQGYLNEPQFMAPHTETFQQLINRTMRDIEHRSYRLNARERE